ncbi:MAG TPA: ABC transporter permease [Candidatus Dormibacteraeota bacterium]|nr:ABC transporter permease [Candidatus Dormibacteraeota bacterium]
MSRLPFELLLALRYLRPKRTFVSVITLISVLGVSLGVAVLIIVISVMSGFDKKLRDEILGFNTHLKVVEAGRVMSNWQKVAQQVSSDPRITAVGPFVLERILLETEPQSGSKQADAPYLRGIIPKLETNLTVLPERIIDGKFDVSDRGLLVGVEFARNMNLQVGDRVNVYSPSDLNRMRQQAEKGGGGTNAYVPPEFEVRGIFDVGYYEYNVSVVVASLRDAQDLYELSNSVHGLLVMLKDPYQAPQVARVLADKLGPSYRVITWMQENANILNALIVEKNVMFYILFFIMIVAALCILSALITFVVQKTREIGMLKALGATDLQVAGLFLSQSALIGAVGDLLGYGLGMLALSYRNEFLHLLDRLFGFQLFPSSIYGFSDLPALIIGPDILLICGSAWLICVLGGVIPAWRAGRLKPVEALRYE